MTREEFLNKAHDRSLQKMQGIPLTDTREIVSRLLDIFEEIGMFPPISDDRMGHFDGIKQVMNFCKWDSEEK